MKIVNSVSASVALVSLGLTISTSVFSETLQAVNSSLSKSAAPSVVVVPKSNDYSGEDELPIPEGVKPIQGLNIPVEMKEIKIYGFDAKGYGVGLLREVLSSTVKFHNELKDAPAIKNNFKITKQGGAYTVSMSSKAYLAFVYALAQEITSKYQADQYLLARAIVPEQTINQTNSRIEICVAEGYLSVDPTIVLPEGVYQSERLKRLLAPHLNHLTNMKPLDFKRLERALLLVRDMPGVEVKTTFKQAPKLTSKKIATDSICRQALANGAGATALEARAKVDRLVGELSVDNFGTDALGPELGRFRIGINSVLKAGDSYQLSFGESFDEDETVSFAVNAQIPIGINGLKGKFFYSNGDAKPGGLGSEAINVNNTTEVAGISLEYPYIRGRKKNLTFEMGLRTHEVKTGSAAGDLEDSNIDTLRLRSTYDFSDKYNGVNLISTELVAGLSGGFSSAINSADLDENFIMVRGELARYQSVQLPQKFTGNLLWINSLSWQYTDDPLFSSEEFALGGRDYGRGFDLAILTGDRAIALKTELQYSNKVKYGKYKTYGFIDYGKVKNIDEVADGEPAFEDESLISAGLGFEFESNSNWFAKVELTNPVDINPSSINQDTRTYFQLGYRW